MKRDYYEANREHILAVNAAYRAAHREEIAAGKKRWADENRERLRQRQNELRTANPERRRAYEKERRKKPHAKRYQQEYYQAHGDELRRKRMENHRANRDVNCAKMRSYTVRRWLKRSGWTEAELERRIAQGCGICGAKEPLGTKRGLVFDHDHITGLVRGLLCQRCNKFLDWAIEHREAIDRYNAVAAVAVEAA